MDFDAIIYIGPQGSGKGTQAKLFAEKLGFFYLGTGAMLREIATHDDALGRQVKETIDHGKLLDDATMLGIVEKEILLCQKTKGSFSMVFRGVSRRRNI